MKRQSHRTLSPEDTEGLGVEFSKSLMPGDIVGLIGELGGGKTCFVRGIAKGLGSRGFIKSPSFTIINIYEGGRVPLYHIDLYRVAGNEEFLDAGLEEFIYGKGISVIEWADRLPAIEKACNVIVTFRYVGENEREIDIKRKGVQ